MQRPLYVSGTRSPGLLLNHGFSPEHLAKSVGYRSASSANMDGFFDERRMVWYPAPTLRS